MSGIWGAADAKEDAPMCLSYLWKQGLSSALSMVNVLIPRSCAFATQALAQLGVAHLRSAAVNNNLKLTH